MVSKSHRQNKKNIYIFNSKEGHFFLKEYGRGSRVADLHLKIGKIPMYSANPWIESFAHTVYDEYHNIVPIYYAYDLDLK